MTCNGDCNQGRVCICECKKETNMTQPKEPKYLYAIQTEDKGVFGGEIRLIPAGQMFSGTLIGKIEVQDD